MFTPFRAIHTFIKNTSKYNTVNLHHHQTLFYDQMLIASKIQLSPQIHSLFSTPTTKKIIFDRVHYFPTEDLTSSLKKKDIEQIRLKYQLLYNHSRFIPTTPFLGYQVLNPNHKNWYIWSYTDVKFVDGKKEFMDTLYHLGYQKNPFFEHFILDSLIKYDCKKNR